MMVLTWLSNCLGSPVWISKLRSADRGRTAFFSRHFEFKSCLISLLNPNLDIPFFSKGLQELHACNNVRNVVGYLHWATAAAVVSPVLRSKENSKVFKSD